MEGTGGPASNHSDVQAEDLTDPVCSYSSVCANEQMLSLSTSILKCLIFIEFPSLMWKNLSSVQCSVVVKSRK